MFWKTHVFGSVFLGSVFAKVSQIPCFCCFFKWKLRGDFQVVVLKAAKTRGFCMVDLCKVKQQASGNDHPNDCDSSNISHRPPPQPPLTTAPHHRSFCMFDFRQVKQPVFSNDHHSMCDSSNIGPEDKLQLHPKTRSPKQRLEAEHTACKLPPGGDATPARHCSWPQPR